LKDGRGRRKIAIVGIKAVDEEEASEGGMVGDCSDRGRRKIAVVGIRVVGEEEEKDEATIVEGRNEKDWIFLRVSQASW